MYILIDPTLKELKKLNPQNENIVAFFIHYNFNNSLPSSTFPTVLKNANVIPVFKNHGKTEKINYRPMSILPILSKVFERIIYNQIYPYFAKLFKTPMWFLKRF